MVCTNCGALIPDNAFECASCGRPMRVRDLLISPPALAARDECRGVEGWLAFLVFYLLFLLPLGTGIRLFLGLRSQPGGGLLRGHSSLPNLGNLVVALIVAGMGIYAGIALWKAFPNAVAATKRFLIAFLMGGLLISIVRYHTLADRIWGVADALAFFLVWYAYLKLSRRVANTYPRQSGPATLAT
jgi:hypothetical protein